ncbi:hypothetical protein WL22_24610 [Burkholderia ubonensis]|nr:hypothetical protein WJ60_32055 [Burkholderia ubonensis]KVZ90366.1 hypothetical protein WL22_24610 [Burkholderia ubonensis]KWE32698.1 hypothetical protein WL75_31585 [Burkholderia ubonensis]
MQIVQGLAECDFGQHDVQVLQQHRLDLGQQRPTLLGANLLPPLWFHIARRPPQLTRLLPAIHIQ